jgi:predicted nucleic acid-binding protein
VKGLVTIDTCAIIHFMYIDRFHLIKLLGYYVITTVYVQLEFEQGHSDSLAYYTKLVNSGEISRFPLEIEDLVEMSNVPESKRASDAELSCFVVAKRIGGQVITDDKKAIKYIQRYIMLPPSSVIQLVDVLIEAYLENHLGDHELRPIQQKLAANNFAIKIDLANEAAKRRWMLNPDRK